MIDQIVKGISSGIEGVYPDVVIYKDEEEQDFKEPSFSIAMIEGAMKPLPSDRFNLTCSFVIKYFPKPKDLPMPGEPEPPTVSEQINEAVFALYGALEYIIFADGSRIAGLRKRHVVHDDKLHMFVTCSVNLMRVHQKEVMEELRIRGGIKN